MSNYPDITVNDFKNICRTCLSTEKLKPLYEKCSSSTCPAEMLMTCTFVKFTENDGLPTKICANCIHDISKAFSFAKRCETTDAILRKCVKIETELATQSQKVGPIIEEEMETEIKPEVLDDYEFVEVKQEPEEYVEEVKQEENNMNIEKEYDDTADESFEEENETYSGKFDNSNSKSKVSQDSLSKGAQLYICPVCGKAISKLESWKRHKLFHKREKTHVCSVCRSAFINFSNLKVHMRIHTGEKPYTCGVCSRAFAQSNTLKLHTRIHTGEKPYTCEVCSKTFSLPTTLKCHMRLHTGEKPYNCDVSGLCSTIEQAEFVEDSVEYDSDDKLTKNKKARGKARNWTKIKVFEDASEAELYIENEGVWSKTSTKQCHDGERVEFRCKKGKYRENECPSAIYLLYNSCDTKVTLYSTQSQHNHSNIKPTHGMDNESKELVTNLFKNGVDKPNAIISAFRDKHLLEPSKTQLNNFLRTLRKQNVLTKYISNNELNILN